MSENTKDDFLIRRVTYPDSSPLTFGKSYCKYNPLLLKTLIGATVELESKNVKKDKDFWIELKKTWLNTYWSEEPNLYENYKNQSAKDDFFNFGYHVGIWDGHFNLTKLAKETWHKYESIIRENINCDENKKLTPFREYFDVFLRNFVVTYNKRSYNPLKSILEKLKDKHKNLPNKDDLTLSNKNDLKKFLENTFNLNTDELPLWKSRIFFLLLSSTTYFEQLENSDRLELKITQEKLDDELQKCNDVYHDKEVDKIKKDLPNQTKKSKYLTGEDDQSSENLSSPSSLNEPLQAIYYGPPKTGKSSMLASKAKNFFGEDIIWINEKSSFDDLFWKEINNKEIELGFLIDFLIKAMSKPDQYFLIIIDNIDDNLSSLFKEYISLLKRDYFGFSDEPIEINDKYVYEEIKKTIKEHSGKSIEDLYSSLSEIKLLEHNKIFFTPNFYLWFTSNNFKKLETLDKSNFELINIGINNNENLIDKFVFKLMLTWEGKEKEVNWNSFRKIINSFLSEELEIDPSKLLGTFFINLETLEMFKEKPEKLSKVIAENVISHLFFNISKFDIWSVFKKNHPYDPLELKNIFLECGDDVFSSYLAKKLKEGVIYK